jgi:hypothetical protein
MTFPPSAHQSGPTRILAACALLVLVSACGPADKAAPPAAAPADSMPSVGTAAAAVPAGPPAAVIVAEPVAPAPAAPTPAPSAPAVVAAPPVVVRAPTQIAQTPPPPAATPPAAVTPVRTGLPAGPGRDTVQRVCTGCHAIGMVTATGRTPDGWEEIIGRMVNLGLEASDDDLQTIHQYLSRELPPRRAN